MRDTMEEKIKERVLKGAAYLVLHQSNVREVAEYLGCSKSTVHKDLTIRLYRLDRGLYKKVQWIFSTNKSERHIRGGETTKAKYQKKKF